MSHLHILTEAQTEAISGGNWGFKYPSTSIRTSSATNLAYMPQSNTNVATPVATGGVGLLGLATGGVAGVLSGQSNFGLILQGALA